MEIVNFETDGDAIMREFIEEDTLIQPSNINFEFKDEVRIRRDKLHRYEHIEDLKTKIRNVENPDHFYTASKVGRIVEIKANGDIMVDFWDSKPAKNKIDKEDLELYTKWNEREDVAAKEEVQEPTKITTKASENEAGAKPTRYNQGDIEVWDAIVGMKLDYMQGSVLKYISRYEHKNGTQDLYKALNYLIKMVANRTGKDYYDIRGKTIDQITNGDY